MRTWLTYRATADIPSSPPHLFSTEAEYNEALTGFPVKNVMQQGNKTLLPTLSGHTVKSHEELKIANLLWINGISFEYESGAGRSTFDGLQSRSRLINAKINLAEAERSYLLAQYRVLKSVGLLNSDYLNLK
mgnify:CR=1 FL=1